MLSADSGNDPQLALGLSDQGGRDRDAIMTGHGRFQPAAKRRAVDGAYDRLFATFEHVQYGVQADAAFLARSDLAELLDVGPSDERASAADEHDALDRGVFFGRLH